MVNPIPDIHVVSEIKKLRTVNPLIRDVVCLIGCFETGETNTPIMVTTLPEAEEIFGDDSAYNGNAALKQIFRKDISGCLIVNIPSTTSGTGDNITITQTIAKSDLETALAKVELISFDMLYVAYELTDALVTVVDDFCNARFEDKRACGYIAAGTRSSASTYTTTAEKCGDQLYAFLTQALTIEDTSLSLIESGAYLTNLIATLPVGNSLTAKVLSEVTAVGTTYEFGDNDLGKTLVGLGFFVVRLIDALNKTYECVNSATMNGLDLYMNRVRDYIVNDFALRDALGEYNHVSMELINLMCGSLHTKFTDTLSLIKDIEYVVEKEDANTVNVIIKRLVFAGIVTQINVYITIEVE